MATMYVYNIPTNETVNLRNSPSSSATILVRVGYGNQVDASLSSTSGWHSATYLGTSGYMMSQYLTTTNPNGGSSGGTTGGQAGVIQGTSVNVRPTPATTGAAKCQVNTGNAVTYYPNESYSGSGYSWYRCTSSLWSGDGYIVTTYVAAASSGGGNSGGGTIYSGNRYLNATEMASNAQYVLNYLRARGWTKNAVCGMLGNMETESKINPGIWQSLNQNNTSGGYGLVQWTPSTKYTTWANDNGYALDSIDGQLQRILYEVTQSGLQWVSTTSYPMTFSAFTQSTDSAYNLACAFLHNYERPASPNKSQRGNQAAAWFNSLT